MTRPRTGALDTGQDVAPSVRAATPADSRLGPLVVTLVVVSLLGALEVTIVGSSLATLVRDLGGVSAMGWVVTAYVLAATVATPILGQLGDIHGRRPVFLASLAVFVVGTALCGVAPSIGVLVVARLLQGVGSAGTSLLSQTILADVLPPRRRPQIMSLLASVFAVAVVIGPLVGGLLTDTVGWRWGFLGIVPLGVVALLAAYRVIPAGVRFPSTFDTWGAGLLGVLLTAFVGLLTLAPSIGWASWTAATLGVVVLASGTALVHRENRAAHPVLPLRLLSDRIVVGALVLAVVHGGGLLAVIAYLPAYTQLHYNTSATFAGAVPLAVVLGLLVSSNGAGALIARTGHYRGYPIAGSALAAASLTALALNLGDLGIPWLCLGLLLFGLGAGSFMHLPVVIVQNEAAPDQVGVATSAVTLVRQGASAVGAAAIGAAVAGSLAAAGSTGTSLGSAYADALGPVLAGLALVFVVGMLVSVATPGVVLRRTQGAEKGDGDDR